jgi:hypothetical protein
MKNLAKRLDILHVRIPELCSLLIAGMLVSEALGAFKYCPKD